MISIECRRYIRFPELLEWEEEHIGHSYVMPDDALADVPILRETEVIKPVDN